MSIHVWTRRLSVSLWPFEPVVERSSWNHRLKDGLRETYSFLGNLTPGFDLLKCSWELNHSNGNYIISRKNSHSTGSLRRFHRDNNQLKLNIYSWDAVAAAAARVPESVMMMATGSNAHAPTWNVRVRRSNSCGPPPLTPGHEQCSETKCVTQSWVFTAVMFPLSPLLLLFCFGIKASRSGATKHFCGRGDEHQKAWQHVSVDESDFTQRVGRDSYYAVNRRNCFLRVRREDRYHTQPVLDMNLELEVH